MRRKPIHIALILFSILICTNSYSHDYDDFKINSSYGRVLVEKLKSSIDKKSTTSLRREQKSVIPAETLHERLEWLQNPFRLKSFLKKPKKYAVVFANRDEIEKGYKNITYTFYGKGAYFWNLGIKTKIKLRARFYLQENTENGDYRRPEQLNSYSFLEVKIKNPSPEELNIVNKYRVKIEDSELLKLINTDAKTKDIVLKKLKRKILENSAGKKAKMINAMFEVIADLAAKDAKFIKPQLAISYERTAKKYLEEDYKAKLGLLKRKHYKDVEYQLTIDNNIKGYRLKKGFMDTYEQFIDFFNNNKEHYIYQYPQDAIVVEIKVPLTVANLKEKSYSPVHNRIYNEFISQVFTEEALYPGFRLNKGKAGHVRRIFAQRGQK